MLSAFRGEPLELDDWGRQVLFFILNAPAADLEITPKRFYIRLFGHHDMDYPLEVAPGVISLLVGNVLPRDTREIRTWVPMMKVPGAAFMVPPRYILAQASLERVTVRLRRVEADLDQPVPSLAEKHYVIAARACPHCTVVPERYRVLWDGGYVCQACGASSRSPT